MSYNFAIDADTQVIAEVNELPSSPAISQKELKGMKKPELVELAKSQGIKISSKDKKDEIIVKILGGNKEEKKEKKEEEDEDDKPLSETIKGMKKPELVKFAKENDVKFAAKDTKAVLASKILAHFSGEEVVEEKKEKKAQKTEKVMKLVGESLQNLVKNLVKKFGNDYEEVEKFEKMCFKIVTKSFEGFDEKLGKIIEGKSAFKSSVKNPQTAYMIFASEKRSQAKEENPEKSFGEISKVLSEMWKSIDEEEKALYEEKAQDDKQRFMGEVEDMEEGAEKEKLMEKVEKMKGKKSPKKSSEKKSSSGRGKSAWTNFCSQNRAKVQSENKGMKPGEVTKKLAAIWGEMTAEEKEEFQPIKEKKEEKKTEKKEKKTEKKTEKKEKVEEEEEEEEEKKEKKSGKILPASLVEKDAKKSPKVNKENMTDREKELNKMKVPELKELAAEMDVTFAPKAKKAEIIALIINKEKEEEEKENEDGDYEPEEEVEEEEEFEEEGEEEEEFEDDE